MLHVSKTEFSSEDLIQIFNDQFYQQYNTKLVLGGDEPVYLPANNSCSYHQIIFAHGYFSSALHEISHWLVAGEHRRQQPDYGYWYEPDGRDELRQAEFEKVEVLPQAIEWLLTASCGAHFDVSSDNLSGIVINRLGFKQKVYQKVLSLLDNGVSKRTQKLMQALQSSYQTPTLKIDDFAYQGMYQLVD